VAASSVLAFWAVAVLLIVVPGADWAFTLGAGLRSGSVIPAVGGLVIGYIVMTAIVAAGVGALVAGSAATLTGLTLVGGLYLMWHGAMTFVGPTTPATGPSAAANTDWNTLVKGIGVSGLNPKALLIFLALLPQFTNPRWSWPIAVQVGFLGLAFTATCAVFYFALGSLARTILHARPGVASLISRISGAAMIVVGAVLLLDRLLA